MTILDFSIVIFCTFILGFIGGFAIDVFEYRCELKEAEKMGRKRRR